MQWDLWTSLQAGIPASLSVSPGSDEARTMTATSGRHLLGLYERCGRVGLLAKMLLATSRWASMTCFLTWKDSATPGKRLLFRLWPSMPGTAEIDCGLWPTIRSTDGDRGGRGDLIQAVRGNPNKHYKLWSTMTKVSGEHPGRVKVKPGQQTFLSAEVNELEPVPGSLNPPWVEWLMGYPIGWTDLQRSETQSSRKSRKKSSAQSTQ